MTNFCIYIYNVDKKIFLFSLTSAHYFSYNVFSITKSCFLVIDKSEKYFRVSHL